jgi:uncharacterized FAD-dependent dehydrogenase
MTSHPHVNAAPDMAWHPPAHAPAHMPLRPVVVGFGPCGIFAALTLAQMGFKPIVLERGKPCASAPRTPGACGASTHSTREQCAVWRRRCWHLLDGKLYSQIKDPRHLGRKVMAEFVKAGAPEEILYVAHPHIGTFKLVKVVETCGSKSLRWAVKSALSSA